MGYLSVLLLKQLLILPISDNPQHNTLVQAAFISCLHFGNSVLTCPPPLLLPAFPLSFKTAANVIFPNLNPDLVNLCVSLKFVNHPSTFQHGSV